MKAFLILLNLAAFAVIVWAMIVHQETKKYAPKGNHHH